MSVTKVAVGGGAARRGRRYTVPDKTMATHSALKRYSYSVSVTTSRSWRNPRRDS